MRNKGSFKKYLAIAGTVLVWLPIFAPIFFSVASLIYDRMFRFDYLMPAELFPLTFLGSGVLLWATLRARSPWKLIGWGLGAALAFLFGGQALATITGLASGATETGGWQWALVLASLVAYVLALVVIGVGGLLLLGDLFKSPRSPIETV